MVRLLHVAQKALNRIKQTFNPTMVRLLRNRFTNSAPTQSLSIPQWCDCCLQSLFKRFENFLAFNPTMVRLLRQKGMWRS